MQLNEVQCKKNKTFFFPLQIMKGRMCVVAVGLRDTTGTLCIL